MYAYTYVCLYSFVSCVHVHIHDIIGQRTNGADTDKYPTLQTNIAQLPFQYVGMEWKRVVFRTSIM